jgi:hypothetical protein
MRYPNISENEAEPAKFALNSKKGMFIIWRLAERIDTKPAQAHNFNFYFNFTLKSWSSGKGFLRILDGVKQIKGGNE